MSLERLLQRADIWRGGHPSPAIGTNALPSGFAALDAELAGGGWPLGALTEIHYPQEGGGELSLLLPALAKLSQAGRWIAWIAPPHLPYPPALAQAGLDLSRQLLVRIEQPQNVPWALEQALRAGVCGAVLGWPDATQHQALRRLQLAAEAGGGLGLLFYLQQHAPTTSPAALRLRLDPDGPAVHIIKRRGGWPTGPISLPRHALA
jgi:cell division inhibitor SulA/protein ImuA